MQAYAQPWWVRPVEFGVISIAFLFDCLRRRQAITSDALDALDMQDKAYGWTVEMQVKAVQRRMRIVRQLGKSKVGHHQGCRRCIGSLILELWLRRKSGGSSRRCMKRFVNSNLSLLLFAFGIFSAVTVGANGDNLYFDCPCSVSSDGETLVVKVGVRNFRTTDSGRVRVSLRAGEGDAWGGPEVGNATIADSVSAGSRLAERTQEATLESDLAGPRTIHLYLQEERIGGTWQQQDKLRMERPVDLAEPFAIGELNYLTDTDGDGVSDANERIMGTDPDDADSTPGGSTIDVVALYTDGYNALYSDPTTRIQHVFTLANARFDNSHLNMRLRVVGTVPVKLEDEASYSSNVKEATVQQASDEHGADLNVLFRDWPADGGRCGWAPIFGRGSRGHFGTDLEFLGRSYATVAGNCSGRTLAHELGHVMGLGHSVWQNSTGTWRWSRGHAKEEDFFTTMSYGRGGTEVDVFSSPNLTCRGESETDKPCGIASEEVAGANAAASLDAVRFQIAKHRKSFRDTDRDGFVDPVDDLPNDALEWWDSDGDGVGNNADADDDGDGEPDTEDAFPLDATESADSDGDSVGDNADAFPNDASETADSDGDGVGDNADVFPDDPDETKDTDGDGVGDNGDPFPRNSSESADTDGDGIGDNADPDADGDGVADTLDLFPLDSEKVDVSSYWFVGEHMGDGAGGAIAASPDGNAFLIGAPHHEANGERRRGAAYLIAQSDLPALDAADGASDRHVRLAHVPAGPDSWKFVGENRWDAAGTSVAIDDIDGDGTPDAVIGAVSYSCSDRRWWCGTVYVVSGTDFAAADAADGSKDHKIALQNVASQPGSWQFLGEAKSDGLGWAVTMLDDIDDDGHRDLAVGAPSRYSHEDAGAGSVYVLASGGFGAGDKADGTAGGVVDLRQLASMTGSWKLVGELSGDSAGRALAAVPDMDDDGLAELLIGAPYRNANDAERVGTAYLVASADLAAADRADGSADRVAALAKVVDEPGSWRLVGSTPWERVGERVAAAVDGEETPLLLSDFLVDASKLEAADRADGTTDATIDLGAAVSSGHAFELPGRGLFVHKPDAEAELALAIANRWHSAGGLRFAGMAYVAPLDDVATAGADDRVLSGSDLSETGWSIAGSHAFGLIGVALASAGDVDGDGLGDLLIGSGVHSNSLNPGVAYLLLAADLPALDRADGDIDAALQLGNVAGDTDGDGLSNSFDLDDDGDGVVDVFDVFPLDPLEWADADLDGFGDRTDAFPDDRQEWLDTDRDGTGDNADEDDDGDGTPDRDDPRPRDTDDDGLTNRLDPDDDNDGTPDTDDAFPVDATESVDTDGDGIGNNADRDDDNDGVRDAADAFPLDSTESADSDGDGTGDNADAFPNDADEQADTDGDGIGDNADTDDDNDGVEDSLDAFPFDATAKRDTDRDGVADSRDAFPSDAGEWLDTDSDGVGNNADRDDDGDGVVDVRDRFPLNAARSSLTSLHFVAQNDDERLGTGVASTGDLDGDGMPDIAITATEHGDWGAVYVLSASELAAVDAADGAQDGAVDVHRIASQANSWKLLGEDGFTAGSTVSRLGDLGHNGTQEFLVGAFMLWGAVYVVSGPDLAATDALDGEADGVVELASIAEQSGSWKILGAWGGCIGCVGTTAFVAGDDDYLLIGEPGVGAGELPGEVHQLDTSQLASMDGADGDPDGVIGLYRETGAFVGEADRDEAGAGVAAADFDGDGNSDIVIGAPRHAATAANEGAVYLIGSPDFTADMPLASVAAKRHSWKFVGGVIGVDAGKAVATGDVNGDGQPDLIIGQTGSARVFSGTRVNLARFDRFDDPDLAPDGVIDLQASANARRRAWTIVATEPWSTESLTTVDADGDGRADILMGRARWRTTTVAELFLGADLGEPSADNVTSSYRFEASTETGSFWPVAVANAGDIDSDGLEDFLIGVPGSNEAYLIIAADLPLLDVDDGIEDGTIRLSNIAGAQRY